MENKVLSEAESNEYFKKATEKIKKHTIQLFEDDDKYIHFPLGTGVLVNVKEEYMILTANHIVSKYNGSLKIILDGKPISLTIDKSANHSILDMTYIKIEEQTVNEIKRQYIFLSSDRIIELPQNNIDKGLIASGYPSSKQKKRRGYNEVEIKPMIVHLDLVMVDNEQYDKYKIDKTKNILLNYPSKFKFIETNDLREFPNPKGLSGGLWKIYADNNNQPNCYLVGIMCESNNTHSPHIFTANRIELLLKP